MNSTLKQLRIAVCRKLSLRRLMRKFCDFQMEIQNSCEKSHKVFINNPIQLKTYVQKYVEVKTADGNVHSGTVYTIDPVSESIVLVNKFGDFINMVIILGQSVKSLRLKKDSADIPDDVFPVSKLELSREEIDLQRKKLKKWLCANRIPIEEIEDLLCIKDVLKIYPPYGLDNCISSNEIILGKVQELLLSMPQDLQ